MKKDIQILTSLYEQILRDNSELLSEMFIHGNEPNDCFIIAYSSNIWKLPPDISNMDSVISDSIQKILNLSNSVNAYGNFANLIRAISNSMNMEVMFAEYHKKNNHLIIIDSDIGHVKNFNESNLIKKVIFKLSPSQVSMLSDPDNIYRPDGMTNKPNSSIYYHGTSSFYIPEIMKRGLIADNSNSNWSDSKKQKRKGKLFITSNFRYSLIHAINSATKTNSLPVIISFNVRFPDLLPPDYDVSNNYKNGDNNKKLKASREVGVYGYSGNILPQNFKSVYYADQLKNVDDYIKQDFKRQDAKVVENAIMYKGMTIQESFDY